MTHKHTKGPWHCRASKNEDVTDICANNKFITNIVTQYEDEKANARLIAAAPDMYEALEKVLLAHDYDGAMTLGNAALSPTIRKMVERTIEKARGQS